MSSLALTIGLMTLLGAMTPGPDCAIVIHHALCDSRRAGNWTAVGITAAFLLQILLCMLGLAAVIQHTPIVFISIKLLGACYLVYLGIKALIHTADHPPSSKDEFSQKKHPSISLSRQQAFWIGFTTNALNPKVILFLLAMFTLVLSHKLSLAMQILILIELPLIIFAWLYFLSWMITHPKCYRHFLSYQPMISRILGLLFISFALAIFFYTSADIPLSISLLMPSMQG
jgi:threonine/homoserine/homoserine lactone efflux protein